MDTAASDFASTLATLFIFGSLFSIVSTLILIYIVLSIWYNIRKMKQNSDLLVKLRLKKTSMTTGRSIKELKAELKRFQQP